MCFLWQDLSHGTVIFDLVTLTLKFDLLLKNFNSGFYLHFILVMVAAWEASLSSDNSYLPLKYDVISQINHSFAEFPF